MRLIVAPAKKMHVDEERLDATGKPVHLERAREILAWMRGLDLEGLKALWACSDKVAAEGAAHLEALDLDRAATPAVLAYDGIQYQYMAPGVFTEGELEYVQEHLRILSGFYGVLRPFDGVTPYRLEMQAKLSVDGKKDLYDFWGDRLAVQLASETELILNLASKEYSKAVEPWLPQGVRFLTCVFGELKEGRVVEKGTMCKMARGQMLRWMAENDITNPAGIRNFNDLEYCFSPERSSENNYVFIKGEKRDA